MKTKLSFVTNSSTSCFVAFGVQTDIWDLTKERGDEIFEHYKQWCSKNNRIPDSKEQFFKDNSYSLYEFIHEWVKTVDLESAIIPGDQVIMIGRSPFKMKVYQTLIEFKYQVVRDLMKLGFDISIDGLQQIEEAWENR